MKGLTRKRLLAIATAGVLLVGTTAASCGAPASQPSNPPATEQEDCDFGDRLEGDSDCDEEGGHSKTKKKTSKPKASKPKSGLFGGSGKKTSGDSTGKTSGGGKSIFGGSKSSPRKSGRR